MKANLSFIKNNDTLFYLATRARQQVYRYCYTDEGMIRHIFRIRNGFYPDLENPKTFSEKIQWLKLHWYDPLACTCADKYAVREHVKKSIGEEYLNELYGVWNSPDEVDLDVLPEQFVLKGTHGSHFNIICRDKKALNWEKEKNKLIRWSSINYYWQNREWVYRDLKPRYIAEKFLDDGTGTSLTDYKIHCFNGEPMYCQRIMNRDTNESMDWFDKDWNLMPFTGMMKNPPHHPSKHRPAHYDTMFEIARALAKPFPYVRVDLYDIHDRVLFGELTFFPGSGLGTFTPPEYNTIIGDMLVLPPPKEGKKEEK